MSITPPFGYLLVRDQLSKELYKAGLAAVHGLNVDVVNPSDLDYKFSQYDGGTEFRVVLTNDVTELQARGVWLAEVLNRAGEEVDLEPLVAVK